jgi:hypothetical protein
MLRLSLCKNISIKLGIALLLLQSFDTNAININECVAFLQYIYNGTIAIQSKGTPTIDQVAQDAAGISGAVNAWQETVEQKGIQYAIDNVGIPIYKSKFVTVTTVNPVEGLVAGIAEAAQAQEHLTECVTNGVGFKAIADAGTIHNTYLCKAISALRAQGAALTAFFKEEYNHWALDLTPIKNCIKNEANAALSFCKAHPEVPFLVIMVTTTALVGLAAYLDHKNIEKQKRDTSTIQA